MAAVADGGVRMPLSGASLNHLHAQCLHALVQDAEDVLGEVEASAVAAQAPLRELTQVLRELLDEARRAIHAAVDEVARGAAPPPVDAAAEARTAPLPFARLRHRVSTAMGTLYERYGAVVREQAVARAQRARRRGMSIVHEVPRVDAAPTPLHAGVHGALLDEVRGFVRAEQPALVLPAPSTDSDTAGARDEGKGGEGDTDCDRTDNNTDNNTDNSTDNNTTDNNTTDNDSTDNSTDNNSTDNDAHAVGRDVTLVVSLYGSQGSGKSEVTKLLCRMLSREFGFDGPQLFVPCLGSTKCPHDEMSTMLSVVQTMVDEEAFSAVGGHADMRRIARHYHTLLSKPRGLLVLDDAVHFRNVAPLLPPPTSHWMVLTTSTSPINIPRERAAALHVRPFSVRMRPLDAAHSHALVAKVGPVLATDLTERVAALCRHMPVALCVVAGTLHTLAPTHDIGLVVAELQAKVDAAVGAHAPSRDGGDVERAVLDAIIGVMYSQLDAPLQDVLRAAAVVEAPFDEQLLGGMLSKPWAALVEPLGVLVRARMLAFNDVHHRYTMHAPVRRHMLARSAALPASEPRVPALGSGTTSDTNASDVAMADVHNEHDELLRKLATYVSDRVDALARAYHAAQESGDTGRAHALIAAFNAHKRNTQVALKAAADVPGAAHALLRLDEVHFELMHTRMRNDELIPVMLCAMRVSKEHAQHEKMCMYGTGVGKLYQRQRQYHDALRLFEQVLTTREAQLGPSHIDVAETLCHVAHMDVYEGRFAEAEKHYKRALLIREAHHGTRTHLAVADVLNKVAVVLSFQRKFSEGARMHVECMRVREELLGPLHGQVAQSHYALGKLYAETMNLPKALHHHKEALRIRQATLGVDHLDTGRAHHSLGDTYVAMDEWRSAEKELQTALSIRVHHLGEQSVEVADTLLALGDVYMHEGRMEHAESVYRRVLALRAALYGAEHNEVDVVMNRLGSLYYERKQFFEASALFTRSLAIRNKLWGDDPRTAEALCDLARVHQDQQFYGKSEPLLRKAFEIFHKTLGADHSRTLTVRSLLKVCFSHNASVTGRTDVVPMTPRDPTHYSSMRERMAAEGVRLNDGTSGTGSNGDGGGGHGHGHGDADSDGGCDASGDADDGSGVIAVGSDADGATRAGSGGSRSSMEQKSRRMRLSRRLIKSGRMEKEGGSIGGLFSRKTWRSRYFELYSDGEMRYFAHEDLSGYKGSLQVNDSHVTVLPDHQNERHPFCFLLTVEAGQRHIRFSCEDATVRAEWVAALHKAHALHKKAMEEKAKAGGGGKQKKKKR